MNVRRLRAIARLMQKYPDHVEMRYWFSRRVASILSRYGATYPVSPVRLMSKPDCNTMGCIGGWALRFSKMTDRRLHEMEWSSIKDHAASLLELSDHEASRLMLPARYPGETLCWPIEFQRRYDRAKTPRARAKVVADRIEHFIVTKGKE